MEHSPSDADRAFVTEFAGCERPLPFSHRDHVRLAYVHLTDADVTASNRAIRESLVRYLAHHGVDPSKYHETLTRAWLLAVRHFMACCPPCASAAAFLDSKPRLLDSTIMHAHYTPERLYSEAARLDFLEPDLRPIPRYAS